MVLGFHEPGQRSYQGRVPEFLTRICNSHFAGASMRTEMSLQLGLCGLFRSKSGWRMWPVSRDSFPVVFAISHCTVRTCALRRVLLGLCADGEGKIVEANAMSCRKEIFGREYSAQDAPVKRLTANCKCYCGGACDWSLLHPYRLKD